MRLDYRYVAREELHFKYSAAAVREAWIAALRSGDYEQGHGKLQYKTANSEDRYCCIGVLAELFMQMERPSNVIARWEIVDEGESQVEALRYYDLNYGAMPALTAEGRFPKEVTEDGKLVDYENYGNGSTLLAIIGLWAGFSAKDLNGVVNLSVDKDVWLSPPAANDHAKYSFAKIADLIESDTCPAFCAAK